MPQYSSNYRRYGPPDQTHSSSQGRGYPDDALERYRAAQLNTTPTPARNISGPSATYSPYYTGSTSSFPPSIPTNTLQYTGANDYTSDQSQQQGYAGYSTSIMYNVGQQATQNTGYDAPQQFQARQPASMQLPSQLASGVSVPFFRPDSNTASGPPILQHASPPNSTVSYPPSNVHGYSSNVGMGDIGPESAEEQGSVQSGGATEAYEMYQDALKRIFYNIREGKLVEASTSTLEVSNWLLTHVGQLGKNSALPPVGPCIDDKIGLTGDDETLHDDRIKLWNEFNTAWLAMLQKQKDLTLESIQSGVRPQPPQSLISLEFLQKMSDELVRLADGVEKHGLVDYQLGVWEENIMDSKMYAQATQ